MASNQSAGTTGRHRVITRRALLGGSAGAAALVVAYATFGDQLQSGSDGSSDITGAGAAQALPDATDAFETESVRISHLLRRTGFGVTREEFDRYQTMGLEETTREIVHYESVNDDGAIAEAEALANRSDNPGSAAAWWLTRILQTRRPLQEKMTLFWHGLLTSQLSVVRDPAAMIAQNELLRANAMGVFPDLLKAISTDPAMMVYLDIAGSTKESPNENYARELMELFSMGEGQYSETDVREAARAFTGWRVPRQRNDQGFPTLLEPLFQARGFDDGIKTFLGHSGNFGPNDIIDIIIEQPASAAYITGRLFSFFVYADPGEAELQPFIDVYLASGYSIGATVEAMLRSDVFYSPRAYRANVKSPLEYAVGATKGLGLQSSAAAFLGGAGRRRGGVLSDMGQIPMEPPNVAGWPGGVSWLNSATLFARLNYIDLLAGGGAGNERSDQPQTDPSGQVTGELGTAAQALDYYLPLLLDDNVSDEAREVLLEYVGDRDALLTAEQLRGLVYIILASPQYQLA